MILTDSTGTVRGSAARQIANTESHMLLDRAASVLEARAANKPVCFCASSAVHSIFSSGFDSAKMIGLSHCSPIAFRISSVNRGPAAATPTITVGFICSRNNRTPFAELSALAVLRFERNGEVQALLNAKTSIFFYRSTHVTVAV